MPPTVRMQAAHVRLPPSGQRGWNWPFDLLHHPGSGYGNLAARLNKTRQVTQILIVSSKIRKRVYGNDSVKKVVGERKRPRICADWVNALLYMGIANSLQIFFCAEP